MSNLIVSRDKQKRTFPASVAGLAKNIADKHKHELGFVNIAALKEAEEREELEVIDKTGFVHFHHRRDNQTTIKEAEVRLTTIEYEQGRYMSNLLKQNQETMDTKIPGTCDQFNNKNTNQETQAPEIVSTTLCPNCDGDGGYVDDNNPHGWQPCSYCGGKRTVSYSEAEEWHTWDDNFGFNEM